MRRPLNFLHLTTFYPPYSFGGDAIQVQRLAHALADSGHHVDVVHCVDAFHLFHPSEPSVKIAEHPRVVRHELRSDWGWLSPLWTQQTGGLGLKRKAVSRIVAERPYDVIHFHNISLLGPEVLSLIPEHADTVKIYTTHEHWLICPMHVLWKYDRAPCDSPQCFSCTIRGKRAVQLWRYSDYLDRLTDHVDQFVAPSRFTANMHAQRGFSKAVAHLPNFIDRVDEDWREPGLRPHDKPYFLFVGRLEKIKGLQTLIALWHRTHGFDLLVAGTGSYEGELRALAAQNPRIVFLGSKTQKELGGLYYHAIACLVPSIAYETFGMTSVEAFARKTPVVVRDLGALPEIIEDGGGGFVYRTDEELIDALNCLASSPELRRELGERGYRAFVDRWSRDAHLAEYFRYLDSAALRKFHRVPWNIPDQQMEPAY